MPLEVLLGHVTILVEKLRPWSDVGLCYEDEYGDIVDHDYLGLTVGVLEWLSYRLLSRPISAVTKKYQTGIEGDFAGNS